MLEQLIKENKNIRKIFISDIELHPYSDFYYKIIFLNDLLDTGYNYQSIEVSDTDQDTLLFNIVINEGHGKPDLIQGFKAVVDKGKLKELEIKNIKLIF